MRKRKICSHAQTSERDVLSNALRDELWLLDTLLTSPLYRHAKSPTLWGHRRWLITEYIDDVIHIYKPPQDAKYGTDDAQPPYDIHDQLMRAELQVVFKAGTQHPKNYPAWDYARSLIRLLSSRARVNLCETLQELQDWCLTHPSDTSGWSLLYFLLSHPCIPLDRGARAVEKILDVTLRFRWTSEAVWGLIRLAIASDTCLTPSCRRESVRLLKKCGQDFQEPGDAHTGVPEQRTIVDAVRLLSRRIFDTLQWIEKHERGMIMTPIEPPIII